jgi:hypothetical protein
MGANFEIESNVMSLPEYLRINSADGLQAFRSNGYSLPVLLLALAVFEPREYNRKSQEMQAGVLCKAIPHHPGLLFSLLTDILRHRFPAGAAQAGSPLNH